MGARAGYTLATGLVIGAGAAIGVVSLLVSLLPEAAVAPILIFIGLEITAQAFVASPPRHAPAVAFSFIPAVAALVLIQINGLLAALGKSAADLTGDGQATYATLLVVGNGFVLTALAWGSALVAIIDRRPGVAAAVLGAAGLATLCGLIHSPLPTGAVFWPWSDSHGRTAPARGRLRRGRRPAPAARAGRARAGKALDPGANAVVEPSCECCHDDVTPPHAHPRIARRRSGGASCRHHSSPASPSPPSWCRRSGSAAVPSPRAPGWLPMRRR